MSVIILYFAGIVCILSGISEIHKKQFEEEGTRGGLLGLFFDFFFWKYFMTHIKELKWGIFQFVLGAALMLIALYINKDVQVFVP